MLDELLEEIQKLREYKTKYEYAEKDKKEMSDLLYKYMMAEYEGKSYDERVREYEKTHAAAVDIIQCAKVKNDCHWIF